MVLEESRLSSFTCPFDTVVELIVCSIFLSFTSEALLKLKNLILFSRNGTFTSPLYPNFYYQHEKKECVWKVHSLGQNKLSINFDLFEYENAGYSCNFTYFDIYDGESMSNETHFITLCPEDQLIENYSATIYTSMTNFMYFKLTLNSPTEGIKFKINYKINSLSKFQN